MLCSHLSKALGHFKQNPIIICPWMDSKAIKEFDDVVFPHTHKKEYCVVWIEICFFDGVCVISPLSTSARAVGAGPAVPASETGCLPVAQVFKLAVASFTVHDWSVFGTAGWEKETETKSVCVCVFNCLLNSPSKKRKKKRFFFNLYFVSSSM